MGSMPGMALTWPPTMITGFGGSRRTMRHISRTLPMFMTIEEMPARHVSQWVRTAQSRNLLSPS